MRNYFFTADEGTRTIFPSFHTREVENSNTHSKVKLILAILLLSPCLQVFSSNSTLIPCYYCKDSKQYGVLGLKIGKEYKVVG